MPLKPTIPYRNKIGPQSDRLMVHFGVDEGSGTDLLNLAPARNGMGDATISGGDWGSDADGALYDFGAGGGSGYAEFTAPGSDQLFPEWTLSIVFDDIGDNSVNRPLFTSSYNSTLATTHGMILCQVIPSGDTLRVSVRDSNGAVTRTLDWAGITRSAVNHLILGGGGQAGVTGTLNGSAPTAQGNTPTAYQGAMRTVTSRSFTLGRNSTPDYGNYKLKAFDLWNVRLTASEIDEIYDDPYLMGREPPGMGVEIAAATDRLDTTAYTVGQVRRFAADSPYIYECTTAGTSGGSVPGEATYDTQTRSDGGGTLVWTTRVASLFSSWAVPWVGRADTDRVTFRFQTSRWLQSASVYVRVRMATTRAGLAGATPTASAQVTTGSTVIDLVPTGLSAGTFYYTAFDWSVDNSAWYPFPCGYGTVTTRKTSGNITPATYSDCHINVGTGGVCPSDIGWGSDIVYNEADYTINAIGYRNRFACWKSASHIAAQTAPTFMLWVGDHFMFDSDTTAGTADDTSDMWQRARSMMCFYARMLKRQCNFIALGNH